MRSTRADDDPDVKRAFARVIEQPASLEARRALASAWERVGNPQAELIRLQLELRELERMERNPQQRSLLRQRINSLMRAHREEWGSELAGLVDRCEFHRGLIAEVAISVDRFVELAETLLAMAPIQHLNVGSPCDRWAEFCELPQLRQIVSMSINCPDLDDEMVRVLANSPNLAGLRWLGFERCTVGRPGVEALAASPYLERVVRLNLSRTQYDPMPHFYDDSGVVSYEPNPRGEELAKLYGRRPWLVGPPVELYKKWIPVRDLYAADDYGTSLELTGAEGDETRVLVHPTNGYSLVVPGRPRLELDPRGMPGYDALVTLGDLPVEIGVQFEELGTVHPEWTGLKRLSEDYATYRTYSHVKLEPLEAGLVPAGAEAATSCLYVLREKPRRQMEFLVTSMDRRGPKPRVVYLTVRFPSEALNPACWANLRAALLAGQRWDGSPPQVSAWPASKLASSDVRLQLQPSAWAEAEAKARGLTALSDEQAHGLISRLMAIASSNDPPTHVLSAEDRTATRATLAAVGPAPAIEVLVRNLDEIETAHDLRAWCWQNLWALIHRKRVAQAAPPASGP